MAALTSPCLSTPKILAKSSSASPDAPKARTVAFPALNRHWARPIVFGPGRLSVRPVAAAPEGLSDKVAESIKNAEEACSENPVSGECVAAWDEVEELSAAASHARDKKKDSDPLESYCQDNPETDECRTYDN